MSDPSTASEPHLLLGHEGSVLWSCLAIDPKGRWIASGGMDETLRLWPMPDLSKPPLHTLPHDELIAKLKTLTNLRVVRDEESSTGWKLDASIRSPAGRRCRRGSDSGAVLWGLKCQERSWRNYRGLLEGLEDQEIIVTGNEAGRA